MKSHLKGKIITIFFTYFEVFNSQAESYICMQNFFLELNFKIKIFNCFLKLDNSP